MTSCRQIHLLDTATVNRIAAGEVIENPSGIIRELLDNAVDAGSGHIEVKVNFNDFFIEVNDDGCGIHPEDIPLAFEKHATSKITSFNDIYSTPTLGFRGEALASLASVSEVTLETAVSDTGEGVRYQIRGTEKGKLEPISWNRGSRIRVRDLFFNTPVRKKFLSPLNPGGKVLQLKPGEKRNIKQEIIRHLLARDGISLKYFIIDSGKEKLEIDIPSHYTLKDKILLFFKSNAYGEPLEKSLLPVGVSLNGFRVEGYVTNLAIRESRSDKQFLIIKNRAVRDVSFLKAVITAYLHRIPRGSHPMVFLRVGSDQSDSIDPNVHPRKEQVKFQNPHLFFDTIRSVIKNTLQGNFSHASSSADYSSSPKSSKTTLKELADPSLAAAREKFQNKVQEYHPFDVSKAEKTASREGLFGSNIDSESRIKTKSVLREESSPTPDYSDLPLKIMGQIADAFILFTLGEDLFIADQHAAHERINFDRLLAEMGESNPDTQMLLIPLLIEKGAEELENILVQQDFLSQIGFEVEKFGNETLRINRVPAYIPEKKIQEAITAVLELIALRSPESVIQPGSMESQEFLGSIAARMACRMSIFSGDRLSPEAMEEIIREIYHKGYVFTCPHGRPFVKKISLKEMKLFFDRGRHIMGDIENPS